MADPQYGGTFGVDVLDIGQNGGTRHTAQQAKATITVFENPEIARSVDNPIPQQNLVFGDVLGFGGQIVVWDGAIRTDNDTTMKTIEEEIEVKIKGVTRDRSDGTRIEDYTQIRPTKLTNSRGGILTTDSARLENFQRVGPRRRLIDPTYTVIQQFRLTFRILK